MTQGEKPDSSNEAWMKTYLEKLEKQYSTKGHKKIWNYFLAIRQTTEYQNKIKNWREWYQIPAEGYIREGEPADSRTKQKTDG